VQDGIAAAMAGKSEEEPANFQPLTSDSDDDASDREEASSATAPATDNATVPGSAFQALSSDSDDDA